MRRVTQKMTIDEMPQHVTDLCCDTKHCSWTVDCSWHSSFPSLALMRANPRFGIKVESAIA